MIKYIYQLDLLVDKHELNSNKMAKIKGGSSDSRKQSFGKKRVGKLKRKFGPKEQRPKKYKGQGR